MDYKKKYEKYKTKYNKEKHRLAGAKPKPLSREHNIPDMFFEKFNYLNKNEAILDNRSFDPSFFKWSEFDYVIEMFLQNIGNWHYDPVPGSPDTEIPDKKDLLDYTKYKYVFFCRPGSKGTESWIFVAQHENEYFVYLQGTCVPAGFEVQGNGAVMYDKDPHRMWDDGLSEGIRESILAYHRRWIN